MSGFKLILLLCSLFLATGSTFAQDWVIHSTSDNSEVTKRHETGSVVDGNKLYVLGGRGNRPVQVFDSSQNKWSTLAPLPMELHHFQPVALDGYIYVIGAFTCCYPDEPSISDIYRLNLATNTWETFGTIPAARLRGSTGTVVYNNKIYLIGGNTNGHSGGAVDWFDEYDPATGTWRTLPDSPNARDHFSAAMVGNKLVAVAGRQTNRSFGGMVAATDVYDFATNSWSSKVSIPTPRAGTMLGVKDGSVIIMGGETDTQVEAHDEVEAYDVDGNKWRTLPPLDQGRHGGAGGVIANTLHAITGNLFRGGGQEVSLHETLNLADSDNDGIFNFEDTVDNNISPDSDNDGLTDSQETELQTDPQNPDSDNDTLTDAEEVNQHQTNPLDQDSDNDGLQDAEEINNNTDPLDADTDADGLSDIDELQTHKTNPGSPDSDGDSLTDFDELQLHFTDPLLADTDNDGLNDNEEVNTYNSDPNAWDSDGDGISDATEVAEGTNLTNPDQDSDGILNSAEGNADPDGDSIPNFQDLDSDNDGISDTLENGLTDDNNDGKLDSGSDASDALLDTDQDGVSNIADIDSDQDGLTDIAESGQANSNEGRVPAAEFTDSNQNGWHDALEGAIPVDTDQDTTPDFLDLDSNDNGITDIVESGIIDADNDGKIDTFIDTNSDGLHDDVEGLERIPDASIPDTDNRGEQASVEEAQTKSLATSSSGGGCTIGKSGAGSDPLLPLVVLIFAAALMQRRRCHPQPHRERNRR